MPTTEERLAALEKQMAAWIDQQPTTYYTHQYSGEEIDNAVARALPNGAIDQAAGTFVRPNLLDNWYFGRPVDQRGWYIVPKGVNYYKVDGFVPQGPIPETVKVDYIDHAGSAIFNYGGAACYVPKDGGYVRGYTGAAYTVDRWQLTVGNTLTVSSGGITISTSSNTRFLNIIQQKFPNESLSDLGGKKVTLSALFSEVQGSVGVRVGGISGNNKISSPGLVSETFIFPTEGSPYVSIESSVDTKNTFSGTLLAAKLELGSTQTLAHKEGDRWVINEIPDYGDQLRRCQRYCYRLNSHAYGWTYNNNTVNCLIPLPVTLRTTPVITIRENGTINTTTGDASVTSYEVKNITSNGLIIDLHNTANAFTTGTPVVWHNFDMTISADL